MVISSAERIVDGALVAEALDCINMVVNMVTTQSGGFNCIGIYRYFELSFNFTHDNSCLRRFSYLYTRETIINVAISRNFSGSEHLDFALDSDMLFINIFFFYLTNF